MNGLNAGKRRKISPWKDTDKKDGRPDVQGEIGREMVLDRSYNSGILYRALWFFRLSGEEGMVLLTQSLKLKTQNWRNYIEPSKDREATEER